MAKFAPQHSLYKIINNIKTAIDWIFWLIFILSVLPTVLQTFRVNLKLDNLFNVVNIICILLFFILDIVVDYILYPQSESKRRDDFIDNSFGSKFSTLNSIGYFDNDEINYGVYKAAVNLFENCFFTYSLIKRETFKKILIPAVVLLTVWVMAYFGFKENPVALSVLQILFSTTVLGSLIRHLILMTRLNVIQDSWINLFQKADFSLDPIKYEATVYRNWLNYETLHSKIPADVSREVFEQMNPGLTVEWKQIKVKYDIK